MLGIRYLEKNSDSDRAIWVLNTVDKVVGHPGELILTIPKLTGNGNPDIITIPQTWLPIDLTEFCSRQQIMESNDFRKNLRLGAIRLIKSSEAKSYLRQEGAQEERDSLQRKTELIKKAGAARTISDSIATVVRSDRIGEDTDDVEDQQKTLTDDVATLAAAGLEDHEKGISTNFKMWFDKNTSGTATDVEVRNAIKNRRSFSRRELTYMRAKLAKKYALCHALISTNLNK